MKRARLPLLLACLAAGLWLLPNRVGAQVIVTGSATPTARVLASWVASHIPARFTARERFEVRPLSDGEMEAYLSVGDTDATQNSHSNNGASNNGGLDESDIDGVFEDSPPRITLRVPASEPPDMYTFAHEYGHYVWFDLFSKEDRKRYEVLYKKQKAAHHLVTRYAQTDVEEGFAEAFSFYVSEPPLLQHRDALSTQFLSQWPAP